LQDRDVGVGVFPEVEEVLVFEDGTDPGRISVGAMLALLPNLVCSDHQGN
jgi:hypothetical protein